MKETKGDRVLWDGTLYKVLQDHTSQGAWKPADAPSLWAKVLTSDAGNGTFYLETCQGGRRK